VKVTSQSSSIDSKTKTKILGKWDDHRDTFTPEKGVMGWTDISKGGAFPYEHSRPLPLQDAEQAMKYIKSITAKYPVQLRYALAIPLWRRFTQTWCETGDLKKALRGI
jgi:hypothetical protein